MNAALHFADHTRIALLGEGFDVQPMVDAIHAHPELWNEHRIRTQNYGGPHSKLSDIWVRYNDFANFEGDRVAFNDKHESVWYPVADVLPVRSLVMQLMAYVGGTRLGGVLITKIPAHEQCLPHVDRGWHATYYEKFAIQLAANDKQAFHFDGESLVTRPGDVFWFDNAFTHWVTNDSDEDRMTLICCIRRA
jgi:hypothetical protein